MIIIKRLVKIKEDNYEVFPYSLYSYVDEKEFFTFDYYGLKINCFTDKIDRHR